MSELLTLPQGEPAAPATRSTLFADVSTRAAVWKYLFPGLLGFGFLFALSIWNGKNADDRTSDLQSIALPEIDAEQLAATQLLEIEPDNAERLNFAREPDGIIESTSSFQFLGDTSDRERALGCLTAAVYYEAGDDRIGQQAVAQVILNRVRHPAYPNTVCGVVFEGSNRKTGCQFTFTCDGSLFRKPTASALKRARQVATGAIDGSTDPAVGSATHYHANYVLPVWSGKLEKLTTIGAHIFYRFPGAMGSRRALSAGGGKGEIQVSMNPSIAMDPNSMATKIGDQAINEENTALTNLLEPIAGNLANAKFLEKRSPAMHTGVAQSGVPPGSLGDERIGCLPQSTRLPICTLWRGRRCCSQP